jgi:DNA-binding NarL/FixJ family response regulator
MAQSDRIRFNALLEAAQSPEPDLQAWANEVVSAAAFLLDYGCGFGMNVTRRGPRDSLEVEVFEGRGTARDATIYSLYERFTAEQNGASIDSLWRSRRPVLKLSAVVRQPTPTLQELYTCTEAVDSLGMLASAGTGRYFSLFGYLPAGQHVSPQARAMLACAKPHIEVALRMRCDPNLVPIAVLTADGKLLHVEEGAVWPAHTLDVEAYVRCLENSRARRSVQSGMSGAWPDLCSGRLSLAERTDTDGRRHYVLFETREPKSEPNQIGPSDRKLVEHFLNDMNGKQVALEMKVSEAQVSTRLSAIAGALGLRDRAELLRLAAVLRPYRERDARSCKLTQAECEVMAQLELGLSNEQIADKRGRSVRTVGNQVASILCKTASPTRRSLIGTAPYDREEMLTSKRNRSG